MEPTLKSFYQRLEKPWLNQEQSHFVSKFEQTLQEIDKQQDEHNILAVLIVEKDPIHFLACFFAATIRKCAIFLADPVWTDREFEKVVQKITPDIILSGQTLSLKTYPENKYKLSEPYIMIPTGGSSGKLKYTIHTWQTLGAAVFGLSNFLHQPQLNACCMLPLHHVSGLMQAIRTWLTGGKLFIIDYKSIKAGHFPSVSTEAIHLSLVPTQLQHIIQNAAGIEWLKQFSILFIGGAAITEDLLNRARDHQLPIACCYGMTETAAMIAIQKPEDFLDNQKLQGALLPHVQVTIESDEIVVSSPALFLGYYPTLNLETNRFKTGDEGKLVSDSHLFIQGRKDRVVKIGGEKVDPQEVERVLRTALKIDSILIVTIPDSIWGHKLIAIFCKDNRAALPSEAIQQIEAILPPYKRPKQWISVKMLPLNAQGKIDKQRLDLILNENT